MELALEKSAMRKIYLRLLPFAILSYILAYIDRINVGFAGLTMRGDLKLSATEFGFALGTFFLGYYIFEVPSNVIMERVGARLWIARIMITWGFFAGLMAFVFDTTSFSIVRFLLGVAEAGFFPGMLLYFTYWFPRKHHARIVSGFLAGLPVSVALGAPISTALLGLDGLFGLKGWQIIYIAEAIPTVVVGILTLLVLTDKGPFFAMPPMFLSGTALAGAGFAWINSIGNLGGTVGPYYVGYMKDLTGNFAGGLYGLALLSLIAAVVCAFFLHIPQPGLAETPQVATPHPA
jgi:MFS family permease